VIKTGVDEMWQYKTFKTRAALIAWIERNGHKYQWQEIALNNAYGVTFKPLIRC
jgi:hypothetical protein